MESNPIIEAIFYYVYFLIQTNLHKMRKLLGHYSVFRSTFSSQPEATTCFLSYSLVHQDLLYIAVIVDIDRDF